MNDSPIVTLTSDFGTRDGYAAAMKGVVLTISPGATVVDVSHDVPPQDIAHGAFVIGATWRYFPPATVHVAVVDPGVGTDRRPLLLVTAEGRFVAPDNGLLSYVLMGHGVRTESGGAGDFLKPMEIPVPDGCRAYVLDRDKYWLKPISDTFHGRDVFAPVAAHLSRRVSPEELGTATSTAMCLHIPSPQSDGGVLRGRIINVDRYGNLASNIRPDRDAYENAGIEVNGRRVDGLSRHFAGGGLVAVIGSHGYLEVALENGSAAEHLGAKVGSDISVSLAGGPVGRK